MSRPTDSTRADARTITIAVTFFADLRRFLPRGAEGPQRYTVPEGATAADLLAAIGVEPGAEVTIAGEVTSKTARRPPRLPGEPQPKARRPPRYKGDRNSWTATATGTRSCT